MLTVCLALLLAAPTLELTSEPSGATVLWTRPESPVAHAGGTTPCTVALTGPPRLGDYSFILRQPGYLDAVFHLSSTELSTVSRRHVRLRAYTAEQLDRLTAHRLVEPPLPAGWESDSFRAETVRAADGLGWYHYRNLTEERGEREQDELWWMPDEGPARRIAVWEPGAVDGRGINSEICGSPDGNWVALSRIVDDTSWIEILSRDGLRRRVVAKRSDVVLDYPEFSPGGRYLRWLQHPIESRAGQEGMPWWEDEPPPVPPVYECHDLLRERRFAIARSGESFVFSPADEAVRVTPTALEYLSETGAVARRLPLSRPVIELRFAPDGRRLAGMLPIAWRSDRRSSHPGGLQAEEWLAEVDPANGEVRPVAVLTRAWAEDPVWCWLPDSRGWLLQQQGYLLRIGLDGRAQGFHGPAWRRLMQFDWRPDSAGLLAVARHRDGRQTTVGIGLDGSVRPLWTDAPGSIWEIRAAPDGDWFLVGASEALVGEGEASLWRVVGDTPERVADGLPAARSLSVAGGTVALVLGHDDAARLWVRRDGRIRQLPAGGPLEIAEVAPDGQAVALGDRDGRAGIWTIDAPQVRWFAPPVEAVGPRWLDDRRFLPHLAAPRAVARDGTPTEIVPAIALIAERKQVGAVPSPDGRWRAALLDGVMWVGPADRPDLARPLLEPDQVDYLAAIVAQAAEVTR